MEIDDLKSDWNTTKTISKTDEELVMMLQENKHPVLKSIRKQIVIELVGWISFLIVYYSMLDGEEKPLWINFVLVLAFSLPIAHSFYGYHYNKYLTDGSNVKTALEKLYTKLKKFALLTILARLALISGLLLFLTYNIYFTTVKYFLFLFIIVVFAVQLFLLYQLWIKKIKALQRSIEGFIEFK